MSESRYTGRVKWFNNKSGFGFITQCEGEQNEKDIFVHWSSIKVENSQYKYLVQGEYVDFSLVRPERGDHEYHAIEVSGVKGGKLMCETRRDNRDVSRPSSRTSRPVRSERSGERVVREDRVDREQTGGQSPRVRSERPARPPRRQTGERQERPPRQEEEGYTRVVKRRNVNRRKEEVHA